MPPAFQESSFTIPAKHGFLKTPVNIDGGLKPELFSWLRDHPENCSGIGMINSWDYEA